MNCCFFRILKKLNRGDWLEVYFLEMDQVLSAYIVSLKLQEELQEGPSWRSVKVEISDAVCTMEGALGMLPSVML